MDVTDVGTSRSPVRRARRTARKFFSIGEVCSMLELKPHVVRYWETQFEDLAPSKNRAGNRVYSEEDVELIALIQRLVHEERYTIEGARQRLEELGDADRGDLTSSVLEEAFVRSLREELERLQQLLTPPRR